MGARASAAERVTVRLLFHGVVIVGLTLLTQIGGAVWLIAVLLFGRAGRMARLLEFLVLYAAASVATAQIAPSFGRQAIPCFGDEIVAAPPIFCMLNRTYVTPELAEVLDGLGTEMQRAHPGTKVTVLDGGFPLFDGFPLLPHLSHDDGEKVDLAFWYEGGGLRSPIGYWAFEDGPSDCVNDSRLSLRWDMGWFQPLVRDMPLDEARMRDAVLWLKSNLPEGGKILLEPHLAERLGVAGGKVRFQGCRAARHDDHIHIQL